MTEPHPYTVTYSETEVRTGCSLCDKPLASHVGFDCMWHNGERISLFDLEAGKGQMPEDG